MNPGGAMLEGWGRDLRYALRRLRTRPLQAGLVVLTLALGVAGTAAVYSIVDELLLEPLPIRAEEEVGVFWFEGSWSEWEFLNVRPQITGFSAVAAYRPVDVTFTERDGPTRLLPGVTGSAELFDVLGVQPRVGPGFEPGDDAAGAEPVVVLSDALWRELGADPAIVGRRLELAGQLRTVVGVMPPGFWFPSPDVKLWTALELNDEDGSGNYSLIGRVAPGGSLNNLDPHLSRIAASLGQLTTYPEEWDKTRSPTVTPVRQRLVGPLRPALLASLGAMAVILLIACVNVTALMLGQTEVRAGELAIRNAMGAGRQPILRQLLVEALALGAVAGLVAAGLSVLAFRFLLSVLPLGELASAATLGWGQFWAAMAVSLVASTAVALAPVLAVARTDLQAVLTRGRTGGVGGRGGRLEGALVVGQVALALMLVAGAALLARSVENRRAIDPGVDLDAVAVIDVSMPVSTAAAERRTLSLELAQAVRSLPGVAAAATTQRLPMRGSSDNWGIGIEARPSVTETTTAVRVVMPGYFETMGIRVLRGRGLEEADQDPSASEGVVVVNQALVDRYFPGGDALGQRISSLGSRWDRIVGVVENVAEGDLRADPVPTRYLVYEHVGSLVLPGQTLVIRTEPRLDPAGVLEAARGAIERAAPGVAIREATTLRRVFSRALGPALPVMTLLMGLAGLALTLGFIGVYGVVSHFVTRRRRDWGIRLALGMRPRRLLAEIVARGGLLVAVGGGIGVVGFLTLAPLLSSFLYEVGTNDAPSILLAVSVLLGAGLLAAFIPGRRASTIDPASTLREE
jgi:putative ABC transport system permease protein